MKTLDLFPDLLAAMAPDVPRCRCPAPDCPVHGFNSPFEPLATDGLGLTEDDKTEDEERYWFWDDSDYAAMVCQKRWGQL